MAPAGDILQETALFNDTSWTYHHATFRTPSQVGDKIQVRLYQQDYHIANGITRFDDVKVVQLAQYVVHDGMITAPMAEFAAFVYADPNLQDAYGGAAANYFFHSDADPSQVGAILPPDQRQRGHLCLSR
jgi:hypothetical protein